MEKKTNKLEELRIKAAKARNLYEEALEKENNEKVLPALRKTVGKCFKYTNSYGGSLARWPLYAKVLSIDEKNLAFRTIEFQHTSLDIVEVKLHNVYNYQGENYMEKFGYKPITDAEYNRAKKALLKFMQDKLSF